MKELKPPCGGRVAVPMDCGLIGIAGTPNRFVAGSLSDTVLFKPSAERNQKSDKITPKQSHPR
ncbi:MAG: hypothetical protein IPO40_10590 [Fibrobacteres bacterium]|nr:hypothetical protein [Fibrobacterota bacterium]